MASDQRWTGGIANREWQAGRPAEPTVDADAITTQVRRYLTDCRRHQAILNAKYHPTEDGCLKVVYHHGDAQKQAVIAAYAEAVGRSAMPGQVSGG